MARRIGLRRSGEHRELVEIRVALLEEGIFTLLSLLHEVIHQCGIAGKLHDAMLAVEFGVESTLDHADGERRALDDVVTPFERRLLQLVERHHSVDHPHLKGLLRSVLAA